MVPLSASVSDMERPNHLYKRGGDFLPVISSPGFAVVACLRQVGRRTVVADLCVVGVAADDRARRLGNKRSARAGETYIHRVADQRKAKVGAACERAIETRAVRRRAL